MRAIAVAALLLAVLVTSCSGPCKADPGGGCSSDSDCVIARCADAACDCSCGFAIARSRVGKDHPCLIATGNSPPASCQAKGALCDCPMPNCANVRAVCTSGQCTATAP